MNLKFNKKMLMPALFAVIAAGLYLPLIFDWQKTNSAVKLDISKFSDSQIIKILKTNTDVADYIKRNPDFRIESKEILTKDSILAGQNGKNFQPVYIGLELQDSRYAKIQLMNSSDSEGYIVVIDSSNNSVQKAFGLLLFKTSAGTK